ncbi:hypothetical protein HYS96_02265 [Candidatus Daviesbacteria bacterium]|nr:hypothetical protein [Candidatus Daviesbacteria bacterium]
MYQLFQTTVFFLLFIVLSIVVFYIPGFAVVARIRKQLEDQEIITLSLALGIVIFVLSAIILALLNTRYLLLPLIIFLNLFIISKNKLAAFSPWKIFIKNKILLILIVLGILTQGFINFPSGYLYKDGLQFWSSQGHDGLWHVASMEVIKKSIPPQNPVFSGEPLYNYHYLVDGLMGEFARIFPFFSTLDLYFRFFPVIFSLLIGISVFAFVRRWQENLKIGYLALFFTYFVGSFGYVVTFIRSGNIFGGETIFWAAQQNTLLGNPPHAISHGLLAAFFLSFLFYLKERKTIWVVVSFLIGSTLAGFKVSGGFVMLMGLGAAALIDFINKRKFLSLLLPFLLGMSNFLTFKWMTSNGSSFLMFLPWWFVRTMIVDKLGWMDLELRRQHYLSKGTWNAYLRVLQLELIALAIFILGNLGMRFLGIIEVIRKFILRQGTFLKDPIEVMLIVTMLTGLIMPMLFVQKGLIYNNIQFMQYFLFIFGFYGAISTYKVLNYFKNKVIKLIVIGLIIVFSIPTVIGNLVELYGPGRAPLAKITNSDLEALQYLKQNSKKDAVILTVPYNPFLRDKFTNQPWPIYAWYDTPYVSAITGRFSYLASEHVRLLFYPSTEERIKNKIKFFEQSDFSWNRQFLKNERISYIYAAQDELIKPLDIQKNNLEIFFENNEIIIFKVKS